LGYRITKTGENQEKRNRKRPAPKGLALDIGLLAEVALQQAFESLAVRLFNRVQKS